MHEDILDSGLNDEEISLQEKRNKAAFKYLAIICLGSFSMGFIFIPAWGLILFLCSIFAGGLFEGLRWLMRRSKGKVRQVKHPYWFEALENALAWWVILFLFSVLSLLVQNYA